MFQDLPRISVEALDMGDIAFWEPPHLHQELDARSPSLLSLRDKTEIAKQSDCQIMASTQVKSRNLRPTESPRTSAFMTISKFSCSQKFGYWLDHLAMGVPDALACHVVVLVLVQHGTCHAGNA